MTGQGIPARLGAAVGRVLRVSIRAYQLCLSSVMPPSCRFTPTCSNYACQAIARHGPLAGMALAVWRILRCNPWNRGGDDAVPERLPALLCLSGRLPALLCLSGRLPAGPRTRRHPEHHRLADRG